MPGRGEKAAAKTVSNRTCLEQGERLLELLLGLAAEPDDDVGCQADPGHGRAEPLHEAQVGGDSVLPAHPS